MRDGSVMIDNPKGTKDGHSIIASLATYMYSLYNPIDPLQIFSIFTISPKKVCVMYHCRNPFRKERKKSAARQRQGATEMSYLDYISGHP